LSALRRAASSSELLVGAWALASSWLYGPASVCTPHACVAFLPQVLLPYLGAIVIIVAAVSFLGLRSAFALGGALSAILAVAGALVAAKALSDAGVILVLLAAGSAALSFWAFRHRDILSEQANPMNLPVFG